MNGYYFTERVRKVLALAREESARLRHEYVGTEHLLLGLIRQGNGVGAAVLGIRGIDLDQLRETVESMVQWGTGPTPGPDLPYTSRAQKALELTMSEAQDLHHR